MKLIINFLVLISCLSLHSQSIGDFVSVLPTGQGSNFIFPSSHAFQKIIEHNDAVIGGSMMDNFDFTGYVPVNGSSTVGRLSINHEQAIGGVTAMDITFNGSSQLWNPFNITPLNFLSVDSTSRNCSGGITPWGTVITCEETTTTKDVPMDGYNDLGWHVETNPNTKVVVQKLWAMGNGPKENVVIHTNRRTAYFGNDASPGYLYKYVSNAINDLSSGLLYVYTGPKNGNGNWQLVPNSSQVERNTTMSLCAGLGGTGFNGIEDVEIGPDGKIYFAVKNENVVYRFNDSDPLSGLTTSSMEIYVGGTSYDITHSVGITSTPWGTGNDNLAFDGQGNLWVLQDGGNNYIWVVMNGHTQASPKVKLFGIAPAGSEPTGITFTPDYKYLFISFQHPSSTNSTDNQLDASGLQIGFGKDIAIVIALDENLGCPSLGQACNDNNPYTFNDSINFNCICQGNLSLITDTVSVSNGDDDAEQNISIINSVVNLTSTDLELVTGGTAQQKIGIRFSNVNIPAGAYVISAYLQLTTDAISADPTTVNIACEKNINAPTYIAAANNITSRILTNQSINWSIDPWNNVSESGATQRSPNLASIMNEVTSMIGWTSSSPINFIIGGTGKRTAASFNNSGGSSVAPRLIISYTMSPASNIGNVGVGTTNPKSKLQIQNGDIYLETQGSGVILKAADNTCWRLFVNNQGLVSSIQVDCP